MRSNLIRILPVLVLGTWSTSAALTCIGDDAQIMKRQYEGENQLSCDTVTVPFGDTTIFTDGTKFHWDGKLEGKSKVILVKGTVIGLGETVFGGSSDGTTVASPWEGILIDSCATADFSNLVVRDASFGLHIRSLNVHVSAATLQRTSGILLPDSSVLRKNYENDTLLDFRSDEAPIAARIRYKCPEQPKKIALEKQSSDFWNWTLYLGGIAVLGALEVWGIGIYKGAW